MSDIGVRHTGVDVGRGHPASIDELLDRAVAAINRGDRASATALVTSLYMLSKGSAMRNLVGRLAAVVMLAAAAMAVTTMGTPAVSSAQCEPGQYWEPFSKACLPLGVGPQPLPCQPGQWWDPSGNICRPLGVGPQPLACDPGQWWDPTTNVCRPLGVGPPGPPAG